MAASQRTRTLTEKGAEMFGHQNTSFVGRLQEAWASVEPLLQNVNFNDRISLKDINNKICLKYGEFRVVVREYRHFLRTARTEHSDKLLDDLYDYDANCDDKIHNVLKKITECLKKAESVVSKGSNHSSRSAISESSSIRAKAKLEAAKARMELSKKEMELKRKQALIEEQKTVSVAKANREEKLIEAELELLNEQKIYAEAEAENEVYETVSECGSGSLREEPEETQPPIDRTENYVHEQMQYVHLNASNKQTLNIEQEPCDARLNPNASVFAPVQTSDMFRDFGHFLVKKDVMLQRFSKFNDDPTQYVIWKNTFKNIVGDLQCTPSEEVDLLIKWLGPESSKQTSNLRAANSHDPVTGLVKIWERLEERYGAPEMVEEKLRRKLDLFPRISSKDYKRLYELCDILSEIESIKENHVYANMLGYYDSPTGVNPVVTKLPIHIQNKWADRGRKYKVAHSVAFPPFSFFVHFVKEMCSLYNDPSFSHDLAPLKGHTYREESRQRPAKQISIQTNKGDVTNTGHRCPLHQYAPHSLDTCREFRKKPIEERRQFLKDEKLCFRCCKFEHRIKDCKVPIKCLECSSVKHTTCLHFDRKPEGKDERSKEENQTPLTHYKNSPDNLSCKCLNLCGDATLCKSCAKILKVNVYHKDYPDRKVKMYVVIDDQSNRTLASGRFFDSFKNVCSYKEVDYTLSSCSGKVSTTGRTGQGFVIEGVEGSKFDLPLITECSEIPDNRDEIPTPDVALKYPYLQRIANDIPTLDDEAEIMLLVGRDLPDVHHVKDQIIGPDGPYAQLLSLGWVVIGETCLGNAHIPPVNVKKTSIRDGRQSLLPSCSNQYTMKHHIVEDSHSLANDLFFRGMDDNKPGYSIEDREFLAIMETECTKDKNGHWVAPLPFKADRPPLPNNRDVAFKRALMLDANLKRNPTKKKHFVDFMSKVMKSGAAEVAPPIGSREVWYLPIFGVYHPKKPEKIRGVFDSSAICKGTSLNSTLLSGPNLINSLLAVLLRFRKDSCAVIADIEQMFYSFLVHENHRDYLRFFWYRNNDPCDRLIEYRMCAHVFGNSPSPAVATYCLRKTVEDAENDVNAFVNDNFYVDDGLISLPNSDDAISLMKRTQGCLKSANLRLHKIASNNKSVMKAFPEDDLQGDLKTINLDVDKLPLNQSLGMAWELNSDCFRFNIELAPKPYTRRGLLSTLNSVYDPLGFAAPLIICGKILLREITTGCDWDEPLNPDFETKWDAWRCSLLSLRELTIPRMYLPESLSTSTDKHLCIYSDASEKAVSAVAYIKIQKDNDKVCTGFVMGKCKLAPTHGHTIPRLELCAALLAAELGETVTSALDVNFKTVQYFTDSRVVLGYINNTTRRFFNYVCNRVQRILVLTKADQWHYVHTKSNPADIGSRGCMSSEALATWLHGPDSLQTIQKDTYETFPLILPDKEVRQDVSVLKTTITTRIPDRFEHFSSWKRLVDAFVILKRAARNFKLLKSVDSQTSVCNKTPTSVDYFREAELFILRETQLITFTEEIKCLERSKSVERNSPIIQLNPFMDEDKIIRVGGRLGQIDSSILSRDLVKPVILSSKNHVSMLLVRHYHEMCNHQGRHITEGAIRNAGFWIVGAKRLISGILHKCVTCRKCRRNTEHQIMADLPVDRLSPGPPFSYVGVDVFGPWEVVARRTRGGIAHSKRWAALFTCLTTRAIHIEVLEEMSSSSFINALRRFIAIRGNVKEFRSDRGTNFVGAIEDLNFQAINVENGPIASCLAKNKVIWKFNPPHSSHMGGVWERMIGVARRILDTMLLGSHRNHLTHEVLITFMAEVSAIVNSRPITPISCDADNIVILTPSMLLNQKIDGDPSVCFDLDLRDMYRKQWKQVQVLSDLFWKQWRDGYLQTLQVRRKWQESVRNLEENDVVFLRDKNVPRGEWKVGVVVKAIKSENDGKVRKIEVRVMKDGSPNVYLRPITEVVLLIGKNE